MIGGRLSTSLFFPVKKIFQLGDSQRPWNLHSSNHQHLDNCVYRPGIMACPITVTKFVGTVSLGLLTVSPAAASASILDLPANDSNPRAGDVLLNFHCHHSLAQPPPDIGDRFPLHQRSEAPQPETCASSVQPCQQLLHLRICHLATATKASVSPLGLSGLDAELIWSRSFLQPSHGLEELDFDGNSRYHGSLSGREVYDEEG